MRIAMNDRVLKRSDFSTLSFKPTAMNDRVLKSDR